MQLFWRVFFCVNQQKKEARRKLWVPTPSARDACRREMWLPGKPCAPKISLTNPRDESTWAEFASFLEREEEAKKVNLASFFICLKRTAKFQVDQFVCSRVLWMWEKGEEEFSPHPPREAREESFKRMFRQEVMRLGMWILLTWFRVGQGTERLRCWERVSCESIFFYLFFLL